MKKYRVTKKHPYLKTGIVLDQKSGSKESAYFVGETAVFIAFPDVEAFKSDGWIEEIRESREIMTSSVIIYSIIGIIVGVIYGIIHVIKYF